MDEGIDSGEILSQKNFDILSTNDARILYDKLVNIALQQIEEFLPQLERKTYKTIEQKDEASNIWRKRVKTDGQIDFRMESQTVYNLVRALSKPYVGAHINYKEKEIIIILINNIDK